MRATHLQTNATNVFVRSPADARHSFDKPHRQMLETAADELPADAALWLLLWQAQLGLPESWLQQTGQQPP